MEKDAASLKRHRSHPIVPLERQGSCALDETALHRVHHGLKTVVCS
jgi:hypothetical protein